ncbi:MAG: alkaline phosphatase family protein [Verrucomicrobiota bacterium]
MPDSKKVMLIGWDAADWKMIHPLMDAGLMPNVQKLVDEGVMAKLRTLSPVLSPMLWTSIATGKRAYKHGIYGFSEPTPDGKSVQPVTNLSRKTKAVWNILQQNDKRSLVVGWWPSHPTEPIDGVMVSNHYQRAPKGVEREWKMAPGTVHPPELDDELAEIRCHPLDLKAEHILPFVPYAHEVDQEKDRRLDSIVRIIADATSIQNCATHLLQVEEWDFAAIYFDAIDHFGHGFMKYHPPKQEFVSEKDFRLYQNVVAAGYVYHDMMLGHLMNLAGDDTTVILLSDHGFHPDHLRPQGIPAEPAGPAIEHRDLGVLAMRGPGIKKDESIHRATLLDITPTVLTLFGLPVGKDMDGRVLKEAFVDEVKIERIASWDEIEGNDGQHSKDRGFSVDEAQEQLDQLAALGYIEKPGGDMTENIRRTQRELDYNLSMSYMDAGLHGEAVPLLAKLYRENPLEFRFGVKLGMCLHAIGAYSDLKRLTPSLRENWHQASKRARERLMTIGQIGKQRRAAANVDDDGKLEEDERIFNDNELRVIRNLRAIAKGDPHIIDFLESLVAMSGDEHDEALKFLERASDTKSKAPGFFLRLGNVHLTLDHVEVALENFDRALELDGDNQDAYLGKARSFLAAERFDEAIEAASSAIALKYHFPPGHYYLACALWRAGRVDEAIESLNLATSQNPNFPEAYRALSEIYTEKSDDFLAKQFQALSERFERQQRDSEEQDVIGELPTLSDDEIDKQLPDLPPAPSVNMLMPLGVKPSDEEKAQQNGTPVTIVSGLPRSGTSMMMQMLSQGGLPIMQDEKRSADENNPKGYFEYDLVKRLNQDNTWVGEAAGKALKVVAPLLPFVPQRVAARVILMERDPVEIVASQNSMLDRMKTKGGNLTDEKIIDFATKQINGVKEMLDAHQVPYLSVNFHDAVNEPASVASAVNAFLGGELNQAEMATVADPTLHRERNVSSD